MFEKIIIPVARYSLLMILFFFIVQIIIGFNYHLSLITLPFFNYLALNYAFRKLNDEQRSIIMKSYLSIVVLTSTVVALFTIMFVPDILFLLVLIISNIILSYLTMKKIEKDNIKNVTRRNIKDYFSKK